MKNKIRTSQTSDAVHSPFAEDTDTDCGYALLQEGNAPSQAELQNVRNRKGGRTAALLGTGTSLVLLLAIGMNTALDWDIGGYGEQPSLANQPSVDLPTFDSDENGKAGTSAFRANLLVDSYWPVVESKNDQQVLVGWERRQLSVPVPSRLLDQAERQLVTQMLDAPPVSDASSQSTWIEL